MPENSAFNHPVKETVFRFICIYLILFNIPFLFEVMPFVGDVAFDAWAAVWDAVVPWTGANVLRLGYEITVKPNGSGDTTYNYVQVFCYLVLAAAGTIAWTFAGRKRSSGERSVEWFRLWVRFSLATAMFLYGAVKVIPSQFVYPTFDRLLQPFGDATPMGLLWTFMGASESYTIFTGTAEMLGGLLLCFRRTTTLGAIVSAGVMANVVMLNFSYDVPVKLYSSHLLLMSLLLLAPDLKRLTGVFLLNRAVEPAAEVPLFESPRLRQVAAGFWLVAVLYVASYSLFDSYQVRVEYDELVAAQPMRGVWAVEQFDIDGVPRPASDASGWRRVIFDFPGIVAVQFASDSRERFRCAFDEESNMLTVSGFHDRETRSELLVSTPEDGLMIWEGEFDGHALRAALRRTQAPENARLTSHGFHWISEYPSNR